MARLAPLGVPFGAPSRIFNIPAPVGSERAGQELTQGLSGLGQALGMYLGRKRQAGLQQQDILALQDYIRQQQLATQTQLPAGVAGPVVPVPQQPALQSQLFRGLQNQAIAQQAFGGQPFTLGPGQQRFGPGGQPIARVPVAAKERAGALQIARTGDQTGLPEGVVYQADPQGNIKIISKAGGIGLTPADKTKIAITQAKEFRADPRIKNFQIIERSERGMQAALKQATRRDVKSRIAADQTLGVLFQKMLDPESVVRESEFARTPEGAAAINRILAVAPQLRLGGLKLLDEDRQALVEMAQILLNEAKISANRVFNEFGTRADEIGLNKKIVFGSAKPFDISEVFQTRRAQDLRQPGLRVLGGETIAPSIIDPNKIDAIGNKFGF